ncbi:amidohydrolase-domain-containing protein [Ganoderma leucocontextum]|nr:amidohydrolase-domain-containing protein [Ganoderma leucocontextum]
MDVNKDLSELSIVVFSYPSIDNHAHAILREENKNAFPFEGLVTEARTERGLTQDAVYTVACYRATAQLSKLFHLGPNADWEFVKAYRNSLPYERLCRVCMEPTKIQCILIDDGLGGADKSKLYDYRWHDRLTGSPTKRIVRVETLAEGILRRLLDQQIAENNVTPTELLVEFTQELTRSLQASAADPEVAGFKSIVCYRTGLDISTSPDTNAIERLVMGLVLVYMSKGVLRLADKALNDYIVNVTMKVAGECGKPVQFHTGLGDNDLTLKLSSPSLMQPLIEAYPNTRIVLLHSSYPYTREAGYLTAMYDNVFLDFGEIFPFVSPDGQREVLRQVFELAPTNKIMWSTDAHFWPESYYLGALQARQAIFEVMENSIRKLELTLPQAIGIVKRVFFENANKVYNLGLEPFFA